MQNINVVKLDQIITIPIELMMVVIIVANSIFFFISSVGPMGCAQN
jgi:hypothetical protein